MVIVLASANQHKIREFKEMLKNVKEKVEVYAYGEILEAFEIVENGNSFEENAALKVKAIYQALYALSLKPMQESIKHLFAQPLAIIAEDSGLCVPALNGEPGIYSARYARYKQCVSTHHKSTDEANLQCLCNALAHCVSTPAFFIAHIALIYIKPYSCESPLPPLEQCVIEHFEGLLNGEVINEARGNEGFGYDPIFIPTEHNPQSLTLAEFDMSAKNAISHRKKALSQCISRLFDTSLLDRI